MIYSHALKLKLIKTSHTNLRVESTPHYKIGTRYFLRPLIFPSDNEKIMVEKICIKPHKTAFDKIKQYFGLLKTSKVILNSQ